MKLLLSILIGLNFYACSKSKKSAPIKLYVVAGSPLKTIEGSNLSGSSQISSDDFLNNFSEINFSGAHIFVDRYPKPKKDDSSSAIYHSIIRKESGNAEYKNNNSTEYESYYDYDTGEIRISPVSGEGLGISLKSSSSGLKITRVSDIESGKSIPVVHKYISIKNDMKAVSFLFYIPNFSYGEELGNGEALIYYTFSKYEEKDPEYASNSNGNYYVFLDNSDSSRKIKWEDPLNLHMKLCGEGIQVYDNEMKNAISNWNDASNGLFYIYASNAPYDYPPFSDLNTTCSYLVDGYLTEARDTTANAAVTMTPTSEESGSIIDSDILFFKKELEKDKVITQNYSGARDYVSQKVAAHELGHFLGLGHKFDGTESIMSYSNYDTDISSYDEKAIQELYKKEDSSSDFSNSDTYYP